jgi:hypothetical protein
MSPLLVVGHRLTPHRLHRRPLAARLPVIVICLPHIRVREKRVYDTDVIFRWLRCRNLSGPSGSERSFRWMPQPGLESVGVEMASAHADESAYQRSRHCGCSVIAEVVILQLQCGGFCSHRNIQIRTMDRIIAAISPK